jgi:predicted aldo/keto reductase-like oxidoreductase
VSEEQAVKTVHHAVEKGVDFIDTSRAYTTSESRIGKALSQTDKRVVLATKSHDRTSDGIQRDIETSLKELRTEYIDLYQCHFVRDEADYKAVLSPGGALEGLLKAKEEGLIGHMGLTSHSLDLLERVIGDGFFETIMTCFSFLEPAAEERVIPGAVKNGIGVIAMKPFSGGTIEHPELALKYVLSRPGIVVIPGVEHPDFFDMNWDIFEREQDMTPDEVMKMEEIRKRHDKVFCRRCDYCQPCSEEIPIQIILGMKALVKRMGTQFFESPHMKPAVENARHCSECGECMERCPYGLPIPDLIKENLQWFDEQKPS